MWKLWLLYWVPVEGAWNNGWEHRHFDSESDAIAYCRDNLELIEIAHDQGSGAYYVKDGQLVCVVCNDPLLPTDRVGYPICESCDKCEG
jgi:hypothetical protein